MNGKSLSEQLGDHQQANEEYKLMKQVDQEATSAARADELTFLRALEQEVQDLVRAHRDMKYSELSTSLATLRSTVNERLIEVLAAEVQDPEPVTTGRFYE